MSNLDRHFALVADLLADGEVVPFLGAGANLCDRPDQTAWESGVFPPSGSELAARLAEKSKYPDDDGGDLLRIAQYVDAVVGERDLYKWLREVFDVDYPPTSLHRLLARLPPLLRQRGRPQPLVLTTNYDDLVERAFEEVGVSYDVVWYEAKPGGLQGRFWHRPPDGRAAPIKLPKKYMGLSFAERPVILKLHGAIDRSDAQGDSFVVTEDSYIDYLTGGDVGSQIPFSVRERMEDSHFLFLGYSMRDWNLRVILKRIWGSRQLDIKSWAVQRAPDDEGAREVEEKLWQNRGDVELLYVELKEYVEGLEAALTTAAPS